MNIFYLDPDPELAATYHCDKHVVKMIMETVQMMSTAHRELDGDAWADQVGLVRATHKNHPSTIWTRSSVDHYDWMRHLLFYLCEEKRKRFITPHSYEKFIDILAVVPENIEDSGFTPPPQCMPDAYKTSCSVKSYRKFYINEKSHFAKWAHSPMPEWYVNKHTETFVYDR